MKAHSSGGVILDIIIREVNNYDKLKLDLVTESLIATLRKTYKPKENLVNEKQLNDESNENIMIIAEYGEIAVGAVNVKVVEDKLHLMGLGILECYRNKGICRLIIDFAIKNGRARQLRCLSLYTIKETGNVKTFEKMGFKTIEETKANGFISDRYESLHEVYMELNL